MTAKQIQRALMRNRYREAFTLNNYTPSRWFECDVIRFTPAGYMQEFEIKVTRADYNEDCMKSRMVDALGGDTFLKHQLLAMGWHEGPSAFTFVVPRGLVSAEDVPAWAGLIEVTKERGWIRERQVKVAPKLHQKKPDPKILAHARSVCYYRMHELHQKLAKAEQ